jgi:hypothetical protein
MRIDKYMKRNQKLNRSLKDLSSTFSSFAMALLLGSGSLAYCAGTAQSQGRLEIVFTDSQAAVFKSDSTAHSPVLVAAGQKLDQPFGICIDNNGQYLVTDTGCMAIIGVDPISGAQRTVASGGILGVPFGIAAERSGTVVVANGQQVIRVDPRNGSQSVASTGGFLRVPVAVAVAEDGNIFVADIMGSIVRVNPRTGQQTLVTSGGFLKCPQGIAVHGNDLYVTDVATPDGNFGIGRIIHINAVSGNQTVVAEGNNLVGPVGISIEKSGNLIVADPYTINPASVDLFDGGIVRVNPATGEQLLIARGKDSFVNPRCVVIVRDETN